MKFKGYKLKKTYKIFLKLPQAPKCRTAIGGTTTTTLRHPDFLGSQIKLVNFF